jgi:hypothetical protein
MDINRIDGKNNEENAWKNLFHKTVPFEGESLTRHVLIVFSYMVIAIVLPVKLLL